MLRKILIILLSIGLMLTIVFYDSQFILHTDYSGILIQKIQFVILVLLSGMIIYSSRKM